MSTRVINIHDGGRYDVLIARPSKWGNPFMLSRTMSRARAMQAYARWILEQDDLLPLIPIELQGKTLGCYCVPLSCHGEILARIADDRDVVQVKRWLALLDRVGA